MVSYFDVLGLLGSFLISASLLPQIVKVYQTKSAKDISRTFQLLYVVGIAMTVTYAIGESLLPIYIPCSMELVGGLLLLAMKFYYDKIDQEHNEKHELEVETSLPAANGTRYNLVLTPTEP
jgi:MtN3 and saliva related transmembrane protein